LEAAEGTVGPHVDVPITGGLRALAAKSLVDTTTTEEGRTRYRMLETVRHYGSQRLAEANAANEWRDRHLVFYLDWVGAVPIAEQAFSLAWANRFWVEFTNISAAIDWAFTTGRFAEAAALVSAGTGAYFSGTATRQALTWVEALHDVDVGPRLRARMLTAGAMAAVPAGWHDRMRAWLVELEETLADADADVLAVTAMGLAAPLMVREPERAATHLQRGREAALRSGSRLCAGCVNAWQLVADLSQGQLDGPIGSDEADHFGGPDSLGWAIAAQAGAVAAALAGDAQRAEALASALSPLDPAAHLAQAGTRIMIEAIAGDPHRAREMATNFITEVDRWSDVAWHGELVVLLGVSRLRTGDAAIALSYFTAARRSTMAIPFWYRLLQHFTAAAAAAVGPRGRQETSQVLLTVEAILNKELRTAQ
jgi:hypothetical protein